MHAGQRLITIAHHEHFVCSGELKIHTYLQTIVKGPVKFQMDQLKTVGAVAGTRYLLEILNCVPQSQRKAESNVPPLFFEKAGDPTKKSIINN